MTAARALPFSQKPLVPEDRIRRGLAVDLAWSAIGAQVRAGHEPIDRILDREYASDKQLLDVVIRAASAPGTTFTSGWANELISSVTAAWAPSLTPSVFSALVPRAGLSLDFTQGPIPSIPSRSATPTASGAFVLEGGAIPVKQLALSASTLFPKKLAVVVSFSNELAQASRLNVEQIIKDEVVADTSVVLDNTLLDTTAATATRPAGLRSYGAGLTATAGGGGAAALADLKLLFTAIAPSRPIIILNPAQALTIASIYDPEALSVIVSPNQPVGVVIALDAAQFVVASGPPSFRAGVDAILHMNDAPIDIASGPAPPTLANIAAPVKSMFQTNTVALRMIWEVNWLMRRSSSVAWLSGATW